MVCACSDESDHPTPPNGNDTTATDTVTMYHYSIVNTYPHDSLAYTQGLTWYGDTLYEGTGINFQSSLRKVDLETGDIIKIHNLAAQYFGEGIVVFGNTIVQLTWISNTAFVYDRVSFAPLDTFHYPTQGWGITYDGEHLIMSDGSAHLSFRDPVTFEEKWKVYVHDEDGPITGLNELEPRSRRITSRPQIPCPPHSESISTPPIRRMCCKTVCPGSSSTPPRPRAYWGKYILAIAASVTPKLAIRRGLHELGGSRSPDLSILFQTGTKEVQPMGGTLQPSSNPGRQNVFCTSMASKAIRIVSCEAGGMLYSCAQVRAP